MRLHEFISLNRDDLIALTRARVTRRPWPSLSDAQLESGIPLFLTQLAETLRLENTGSPYSASAIGSAATKHGGHLRAEGFTVSQVVHAYGDVCQAITELAFEREKAIGSEEFQTLSRCLDDAIAQAVTEYGRLQAQAVTESGRLQTEAATESGRMQTEAATESGRLQQETSSREEVERLGHLAHELRNKLNTALLSFEMLKSGSVGIGGSTGAVLGRSLIGLRDLIDRSLSEVRLDAGTERRERVSMPLFVDEVTVAANLHAEYRDIRLTVGGVSPSLAVTADPHLLASAVMNLLQNAFKYTRPHGLVTLRTSAAENGRVLIEVEDECGGFAKDETAKEMFQPFGDRRKDDRSGLGLGLSISRRAVRASGGEIRTRNIPGKGCVFTIDLPAAE
jgi:signal transduction histidine kinase